MNVEFLPVEQVELDMNNPRIARMLEMYDRDSLSAEQISMALGAGDSQTGENYTTFYSLKESIRTNGGIIQPIIVNKQDDGRLVVIEGNTRVQVYRDFTREGVDGNWDEILAVVHDDLDQKDIDAIRLQAHLVGPRPWDPYSKAKYLNYLRGSKHLTLAQIVEFCGGRKKQILDYVAAYHDMEDHYRSRLGSDTEFDSTRFSAFVELQRPTVGQAVMTSGYNKGDFAQWVIDGLFKPLQTIRQLPRILSNEEAKEVFLEDGAQEALKLLDAKPADASLEEVSLAQLAQELARRISKLELRDIQRLKADHEGHEREVLYEARLQLEELFSFVADGEDE